MNTADATAPSSKRNRTKPDREYQLWAVIPDVHLPREAKQPIDAVEQFLADEWLDGWVCLGDLLDCEAISDFERDYPRRRVAAPTLDEQFDYANVWLDRHLAAVRNRNPEARCVYLSGNHEFRTERYTDRNPELGKIISVPKRLQVTERRIEYIDFWGKGDLFRLGKLYLGHGVYAVQNHAAKHVREYGCNLVYGHVHDMQSHYIRRRGSQHPLMAMSLGCLCEYEQAYMRGRPNNWIWGFGLVFLFPDGCFQVVPVTIINNRFVSPTTGKVYRGQR